jgi:hypothetical protein
MQCCRLDRLIVDCLMVILSLPTERSKSNIPCCALLARQVHATFAPVGLWMWRAHPAWIWRICHANVTRKIRLWYALCSSRTSIMRFKYIVGILDGLWWIGCPWPKESCSGRPVPKGRSGHMDAWSPRNGAGISTGEWGRVQGARMLSWEKYMVHTPISWRTNIFFHLPNPGPNCI